MKIRIDKSISELSWYREQIGSELNVTDNGDGYFKINGHHLFIHKNECTVLSYTSHDTIERPPLGLVPKWKYDELRIVEILNTVNRYRASLKDVPQEWMEELFDLLSKNTVSIRIESV